MKRKLIILGAFSLLTLASLGETPSKLIDLSCWKLTLPALVEARKNAVEIKQPVLKSYTSSAFFHIDEAGEAVVFRAPCGGNTTKNSKYPRCELREMTADGKGRASWSTDNERGRVMKIRVAVTNTPEVKKHVVCAQIHDSEDDLIMIRLEGKHLFVERKPHADVSLDRDYVLGTPFDLKVEAKKGHVKVWYNSVQKFDWEVSSQGCYFKAGCYTQSNTKKGDKAKAYGEVKIYSLEVIKAGVDSH